MTTIIMRTTNDNRFLSLGSLPVTLVFHEAPTGTRENID